ncbi:MAG: transposase, partial [Acidimicrobiales bacterium]
MTLGVADRQGNLLDDMSEYCEKALAPDSIYAFLHRERDRLFPDEDFADLYQDTGRCSVPPSVVASVMVLQRLEGLSDREAVERCSFDARWRYACGVGSYDTGGWSGFAHTVLVDMRMRLRGSVRPDRVFEVALDAAKAAGLVGKKRVLDSTPLLDAVATMDTITLIRSAIRGLLRVADDELRAELRAVITSGDDYASSSKPQVDWDDREAQAALIDSRAKDGFALIMALSGRELSETVVEAAVLLATVLGQDLEETEDGRFAIARRVARDRVISTVDSEARHGHKTAALKGHVAIDPDSEIITATTVTAGNAGDGSAAANLIADLIGDDKPADDKAVADEPDTKDLAENEESDSEDAGAKGPNAEADPVDEPETDETAIVYGDNAYGSGRFQDLLEEEGIESRAKTQNPVATNGLFTKDRFRIDLEDNTVTCPAGITVKIRRNTDGSGT